MSKNPYLNLLSFIIKPSAVRAGHAGSITKELEDYDFRIVGMKMHQFTLEEAQEFYAEHKNKTFFEPMTIEMASSPSVVLVLEYIGEGNGLVVLDEIVGATNPEDAAIGTFRHPDKYGEDIEKNGTHRPDSLSSALREVEYLVGVIDVPAYIQYRPK